MQSVCLIRADKEDKKQRYAFDYSSVGSFTDLLHSDEVTPIHKLEQLQKQPKHRKRKASFAQNKSMLAKSCKKNISTYQRVLLFGELFNANNVKWAAQTPL